MAEIVGRVRFISSLDGRGNERDAERLGKQMGKAGAKGYDEEWQKAFRETLSKSGRESFDRWTKSGSRDGGTYGKFFSTELENFITQGMERARRNITGIRFEPGFLDDFSKGFRDADEAVVELNKQLDLMKGHFDGRVLNAAQRQVDAWAESQRQVALETERTTQAQERFNVAQRAMDIDRQNRALGQYTASVRRLQVLWDNSAGDIEIAGRNMDILARRVDAASASVESHGLHWRDLSHNTRQWTLIIGAVMAAMQDLAVLGSAAGAGLVAVGGAATSGVAGVGGLVAAFVTLNKEVSELPAHLRPVAREFQAFTPVFSELREAVSSGAFPKMAGSFDRLGSSLRSITPELEGLGRSVGEVWDDFTRGTREGSEGLAEIRRALRLAGPNFEELADAAGTFGLALLRSFNRAQPLVEDLIGWLDLLATRFDDFTRSNAFDDWMRNAQTTFSSFGALLDATGRALNDLVTPETVVRTAQFLDNLTEFMPNLSKFLDFLGRLDVFGIIAAALNELGVALEPLSPVMNDLADVIATTLLTAIPVAADAIRMLATAIAPAAQSAADFLEALPPDVIQGITVALIGLAGAFGAIRAAQGASFLIGLAGGTRMLKESADAATGSTSKLGASLQRNLGRAGLVGIAIAGVVGLSSAIVGAIDDIRGMDDQIRNLVAGGGTVADAFKTVSSSGRELTGDLDAITGRLGDLGNFWVYTASGFDDVGQQAVNLSNTLKKLDPELVAIANVDFSAATEQFSAYAEELGVSGEKTMVLISQTEGFKAVLEAQARQMGIAATDANLVALALGEMDTATKSSRDSIESLGGRTVLTGEQIDSLSEKVRGFTESALTSRSAQREFEAATDAVTEALAENGATLDITTEQGRANEAALDDLATATMDLYDDTLKQKDGQIKANDVMRDGRQRLIDMLGQFGITGQAAEDYADELGLIPEDLMTEVELRGVREAEAAIANLVRQRSVTVYAAVGGWAPGVDRPMASGGILNGPTRVLAGEAGREAFVPLERPLSQIDPSVRWLAAIAQGKATPAMASGGTVGGGGGPIFTEGAIVVEDRSGDPRRTGNEVLQRIIENVAS